MTASGKQLFKTVLLTALLYLSAAAQQHTITGKMIGVSDGDTDRNASTISVSGERPDDLKLNFSRNCEELQLNM
jgi:hypothetical protein